MAKTLYYVLKFIVLFIMIFTFGCASVKYQGIPNDNISVQKEIIAIAEFEGQNIAVGDARVVSNFLRNALVNTRAFKVVDRTNMDKILDKNQFPLEDCINIDCAVRMGKILNVQKIVIGTFSKVLNIYYITANWIDVETAELEFSETTEFYSTNNIKSEVDNLADRLMARSASIALNQGKKEPTKENKKPDQIIKKEEASISSASLKKILKAPASYKNEIVRLTGKIEMIQELNWIFRTWWSEGTGEKSVYNGKTWISVQDNDINCSYTVLCTGSVPVYLGDEIEVTGWFVGDRWKNQKGSGGGIIIYSDNHVISKQKKEKNRKISLKMALKSPISYKNNTVVWSGRVAGISPKRMLAVWFEESEEKHTYEGKTISINSDNNTSFSVLCPGAISVKKGDNIVVTGRIIGNCFENNPKTFRAFRHVLIYSEDNKIKKQ